MYTCTHLQVSSRVQTWRLSSVKTVLAFAFLLEEALTPSDYTAKRKFSTAIVVR